VFALARLARIPEAAVEDCPQMQKPQARLARIPEAAVGRFDLIADLLAACY
jgi:hypothetical protein